MKISQREARRLRKRVQVLEEEQTTRISRYRNSYPGGVHLVTLNELADYVDGQLAAAAKLGAALVGRWDETGKQLYVYAVLP